MRVCPYDWYQLAKFWLLADRLNEPYYNKNIPNSDIKMNEMMLVYASFVHII